MYYAIILYYIVKCNFKNLNYNFYRKNRISRHTSTMHDQNEFKFKSIISFYLNNIYDFINWKQLKLCFNLMIK